MAGDAARRWALVVADAEQSELPLRAFAEARGVNPRTLAWWKWRLAREAEEDRVDFVEAVVLQPSTELRVRVGEAVMEVDTDTDLELLARVIRALS